MKKNLLKMCGVMLALLSVPDVTLAQTTLASWTFETDYDVSELTYTPNTSASSDVTGWFNAGQPIILPNTYTGTQSNYSLTGKSARYWQFATGYNNRVFRIENTTESNNITDYTNASQHLNYYEVTFPATGYKDISVAYAMTYGNNEAVDITAVVSIDGGTTWLVAGTNAVSNNWYTYNEHNVSLAVSNQSSVKVRLLFANGCANNWNLDYLNITGTAITTETFYTVTASSDDSSHGSVTMSPAGGIYENGGSVTVTANQKTGYKFKEWQIDGTSVSTDNPYVYTVTGNADLSAVFESNTTYTLTTNSLPSYTGKVTRSAYQDEYDANASITLTAIPNTGYTFVEWQDGEGNQITADNPYTFSITANSTAIAVFKGAVIAANSDITIASWTFDTGYDISGSVYTPNVLDWAEVSQTQSKNSNAKIFNANIAYGPLTNYEATVSNDDTGKTYYSVKANNTDKIFSLYPSGISNSVTDYTNASEHLVYYQFSFPTTGLKDVNVSFGFTYGSNAVRNLEFVYSTDGGTTWIDGGACAGGANWYTYSTVEKSINADNKANVIVRLLTANGEEGDYRMNSFTVTGKIATDEVVISDKKYATYYNSIPVLLPENTEAATIDGETDGVLTLNYRYTAGDVIPGGTPVVLKATAADTYNLTFVANDATAVPAGNYLYGSDEAVTTTGGGDGAKYYALQDGANGVGFYWMVADGAAFTSSAHKAWLALPYSATARKFMSLDFDDMQTTGVNEVNAKSTGVNGDVYNLNGQRVHKHAKGLYIVRGKKVAVR